ncbi:MAG: glycoside hydrolase family 15 protein, partial [Chloroflexota bacterium]
VLRYRVDETDDGLGGREGTFTICSFWLVTALVEIGELDPARKLCERLLSFASPLGLFGEEIDAQTGRQLGNFPQAFTHLALINAVMHIIHAERRASAGPLDSHVGRASKASPAEMPEPSLSTSNPWPGGNGAAEPAREETA